jgi:hypothetical protein
MNGIPPVAVHFIGADHDKQAPNSYDVTLLVRPDMLLNALLRPCRSNAKLQMDWSAIGEADKDLTDVILKCRSQRRRIDALQSGVDPIDHAVKKARCFGAWDTGYHLIKERRYHSRIGPISSVCAR